jgi:GDP-L-fucose synthase
MKILLTGGNGFLGKYVYETLNIEGYTDIKVFRSNEYDLKDSIQTLNLLDSYKPDIVIHLAATVGGIGANMKNPGKYFYDNMMMGLNLIESSRIVGIHKFIQVGTVCSYPKYCAVPFKEDDLWEGYPEETNAPYGVAKKALYVMLQAYKQQYNFNSTVLIPCNLYGPHDNFNPDSSHVIPALIKKIVDAQAHNLSSVECWGTGNATREFLYAEDAAKAIVSSISVNTDPSPINLGTGQDISIKDLMEKICNILNYKGILEWNTSKPDGQPKRRLDVSLSEKVLGWKSQTTLDDGLKQTIAWYLRRKL